MLRPAAPEDLSRVHAIYMHPAVVPFLGVDPLSPEAFRPVFDALCREGRFLVWEAGQGIEAFCRIARGRGRSAHVATFSTFAVAPEAQGRGLAGRVLDAALQALRGEGVRRVELTVEADNPRAQAFYRRAGFVHEGTLRAAYRRGGEADFIDELCLARWLGAPPRPAGVLAAAPGGLEVRHATQADVDAWAAQRAALWPDEDAAVLQAEASDWFERDLAGLAAVLVAGASDGGLLGFAEAGERGYAEGCMPGRVAFLEAWFVRPEARGRGIGRLLVDGLMQWARGRGLDELASDALAHDADSRAAHRALGFEEVETVRCFRRTLRMR